MVQCLQVSTSIRFLLLWRRHSKQLAIGVLVAHMDFKCSHTPQVMLQYSRRWDISFRLFLSHNKHVISQNSMLFPLPRCPWFATTNSLASSINLGSFQPRCSSIQNFTAEESSCYRPSTDYVRLAGLLAVPISPLKTRIIILFGLIDPLQPFPILES
ncbi:hypothetical protein CY34DRAFT_806736 [Suillus luteus UH-Slu-Lm8-n1]|uniref:Uncharacterized protein n=1 Tax=Suillus luteus UH-Slu-Lm8-n1 TaxID=930992 RepID=A0A0C9ZSS1_9AGAM|nr:hypothetical protein CY34DRAFT_806736 [Suillus luteus UH-Slu-Lm8-n1]